MSETPRRFPAPWHADPMPGGYVVRDANGNSPIWRSNPSFAPICCCFLGVPDSNPAGVSVADCTTSGSFDIEFKISVFALDGGPINPSHTGSPGRRLAAVAPRMARIGVSAIGLTQRRANAKRKRPRGTAWLNEKNPGVVAAPMLRVEKAPSVHSPESMATACRYPAEPQLSSRAGREKRRSREGTTERSVHN
jgi:hypothetical protein